MQFFFFFFFMADIETKILSKSVTKPTIWKRCIDDTFSLWDVSIHEINKFIEVANYISINQPILDKKTHFKPTETFQYIHFASSHPLGVKKSFVKGEALRCLRD